jgi:hypothetical protein
MHRDTFAVGPGPVEPPEPGCASLEKARPRRTPDVANLLNVDRHRQIAGCDLRSQLRRRDLAADGTPAPPLPAPPQSGATDLTPGHSPWPSAPPRGLAFTRTAWRFVLIVRHGSPRLEPATHRRYRSWSASPGEQQPDGLRGAGDEQEPESRLGHRADGTPLEAAVLPP